MPNLKKVTRPVAVAVEWPGNAVEVIGEREDQVRGDQHGIRAAIDTGRTGPQSEVVGKLGIKIDVARAPNERRVRRDGCARLTTFDVAVENGDMRLAVRAIGEREGID